MHSSAKNPLILRKTHTTHKPVAIRRLCDLQPKFQEYYLFLTICFVCPVILQTQVMYHPPASGHKKITRFTAKIPGILLISNYMICLSRDPPNTSHVMMYHSPASRHLLRRLCDLPPTFQEYYFFLYMYVLSVRALFKCIRAQKKLILGKHIPPTSQLSRH